MVQHRFYARFIAAREPSFLALVLSFAVAFPANQHREVTFMDTCFHSVIFFSPGGGITLPGWAFISSVMMELVGFFFFKSITIVF